MDTFILNDETKYNSYGFRILNAGLNLERFKANPVMLNQHWNFNDDVIGKWNNVRVEGNMLKADPEFDIEDENAKWIKSKVDRGYIRGVSLGIIFDREKMQVGADGKLFLAEAEVMEASIVAVPSNSGALKLYAPGTHELMTEEQVKLSLSAFSHNTTNKKINNMSKFLLTAVALAALGLETSADEQSISASIEELHRKHKAAVLEKTELEAKLTKFQEAQVKTLIDGAVESGKLSAEVTEDFRKMATENYALAAKVIAGMPAKKSLAGQVSNSTPEEVKTLEDFQKLPLEKQLAFKQDNPDAYKAIVK